MDKNIPELANDEAASRGIKDFLHDLAKRKAAYDDVLVALEYATGMIFFSVRDQMIAGASGEITILYVRGPRSGEKVKKPNINEAIAYMVNEAVRDA